MWSCTTHEGQRVVVGIRDAHAQGQRAVVGIPYGAYISRVKNFAKSCF